MQLDWCRLPGVARQEQPDRRSLTGALGQELSVRGNLTGAARQKQPDRSSVTEAV